ncbi:MAG TPA: bifunctional riboflavin kinase/FAD synthetase [Longimicrobiaceae bacterium]
MKVVDAGTRPPLSLDGEGAVVTVGTFDGVHLGHREVLAEIVRRARSSGRRSVLVTFEPHPLRVIRPEQAPQLLTPLAEKTPLLAESGLDYTYLLEFNRELQAYPARRFVTEILLERVGMRELVMGYDHGFGRGRDGSVDTLRELGAELGFAVDVVDAVTVDGGAVSSTRIRDALGAGDMAAAGRLLGRPYALRGEVVHGTHRGRELGFPTANLRIESPEKLLPLEGIYAVHGRVGGKRLPGLLHLGPRPTFPGVAPSVELHLLDWSGDLYGAEIQVDLCKRMRGVEAYDSAEDLVAQMHRDAALGREILRDGGPDTACANSG